MSDPIKPDFKPGVHGTDGVEAAGAYPNIPPLPQNSCVLAVRPAPDKVHTFLRLVYDVTHLSEDSQKLLVFALTEALTELEKGVVKMNRIEIAAKLAQRERINEMRNSTGNGTGNSTAPP